MNNWLTSTVFDLSEPRGIEAEEALNEAKELLRRSIKTYLDGIQEIDQKLRRVLSDVDPFWIRWSYHLDQIRGQR